MITASNPPLYTLGHNGHQLPLRALTVADFERYGHWLEGEALRRVMASPLPSADRKEAIDAVTRQVAEGVYRPGGESFAASMKSFPGIGFALFLSAGGDPNTLSHAEATAAWVKRHEELASVIGRALEYPLD